MKYELKSAVDFYYSLKKIKESGQTNIYEMMLKNVDIFNLTELEIADAPEEFQIFVKENNFLVTSYSKHGFTEPYEDFLYSLDKLKGHVKITEQSLFHYYYVIEANPEFLFEELDYKESDHDYDTAWNDFKYYWEKSYNNVLYEHSLINLLALFEAFMSNMLKWIYVNDDEFIKEKKTLVSFNDVLSNYDTILNFFVNEYVVSIKNWNDRLNAFQKPLGFSLKETDESNIIQEAIEKRNLIIHHGGKVSKRFHSTFKNSPDVGSRLIIDKTYYNNVQSATEKIVGMIEQTVSKKINKNI